MAETVTARWWIAVCAMSGAALVLVIPLSASGARSAATGRFALVVLSSSGRGQDIFTMNADGTNEHRLTTDGASSFPSWSPNGRELAFVSARTVASTGIFIIGADGKGLRRVTHNPNGDSYPAWSPDGNKIVFTRRSPQGIALYVVGTDGRGLVRLTAESPGLDCCASWSPNRRIVFESTRAAPSQAASANGYALRGRDDIYVMNADGSKQTRLTIRPENLYPSWSPDGRQIVFLSTRGGKPEIYLMNADGTNQRRLTPPLGFDVSRPLWSPDGKSIAFSTNQGATSNDQVYVIRADGSHRHQVTSGHQRRLLVSWGQ